MLNKSVASQSNILSFFYKYSAMFGETDEITEWYLKSVVSRINSEMSVNYKFVSIRRINIPAIIQGATRKNNARIREKSNFTSDRYEKDKFINFLFCAHFLLEIL